MEGLVALIAECAVGFTTGVVGLIGALIDAFLTLLSAILGRSRPGERKPPPAWIKSVGRFFLISGVAIVLLLGIAQGFFGSIVGGMAAHYLDKKGIAMQHQGIRGNFFTGRMAIADLRLESPHWQIAVDHIEVNLALTSLLFSSERRLQQLTIQGFSGDATMLELPRKGDGGRKKHLTIEDLHVTQASMTMRLPDGSPAPVHSLTIDHLEAERFRSRWSLFYLFFRSNLQGTINGNPLVVSVEDRAPKGKRTRWQAKDLPVLPFASAGGLFSIFADGRVSIDVTDEWLHADTLEVDLDWCLRFTGIRATAPPDSVVRKAVAAYFNARTETPIEIAFRIQMDPDVFEGDASEAARALYQAIETALIEKLAGGVDGAKEKLDNLKDTATDGLIDLLDRARKRD